MRRLAIDGGTPLFDTPLHVGGPNVVNRAGFQRRLDQVLDTGRLTNFGPLVAEFERDLAAHVGTSRATATCNGTVGLEIAIRALGMEGEVIVPAWTFVATAHSVQWQGMTPVFADVDPRTHTLDPAAVEAMITPRTTGIIGVHLWGAPCDDAGLRAVADRHGLALLYDGAHAFGATHDGTGIGALGDAMVLSFHATKFLNTFEGGAVVTNDDALADTVRSMTNFGFAGRDRVDSVGTNGKMHEVAAAMGLAQLEVVEETLVANAERWLAYERGLAGIPGIRLVDTTSAQDRRNHQYVVVDVDPAGARLDRDELVAVLEAEGVLARRYFFPGVHRLEPYRSLQPHAGLVLPVTEWLADRTMTLPTGLQLGVDDIERVCDVVRTAVTSRAASRATVPAGAIVA